MLLAEVNFTIYKESVSIFWNSSIPIKFIFTNTYMDISPKLSTIEHILFTFYT